MNWKLTQGKMKYQLEDFTQGKQMKYQLEDFTQKRSGDSLTRMCDTYSELTSS